MSEPSPASSDERARPERCLSFTVRGPWGHFRRIEGNIVKQTYRVIPRTTIAGLVAAMLGLDRDSYYERFGPDNSHVAIEPAAQLRTMKIPMNTLSTAASDLSSLNPRGKLSIKLPDPSKPRQQHNYEVLVDPAYRIDIALDHDETYRRLRDRLESGESYYTPSLGLSEYLATIEYHGEFDVEMSDTTSPVEIDSTVPDAVDSVRPQPGQRYQIERTPAYMTSDDDGRTTTGFVSYAYNPDAGPLTVDDVEPCRVDGRTVVFT